MGNLENLLDHYRGRAGLEWQELAERAGITVSGLRRIRTGETTPRASTIRDLERALGLPRHYLLPLWLDPRDPAAVNVEAATPSDLDRRYDATRERRADWVYDDPSSAAFALTTARPGGGKRYSAPVRPKATVGISIPVPLESLQKLTPGALHTITATLQKVADSMIAAHTAGKEN